MAASDFRKNLTALLELMKSAPRRDTPLARASELLRLNLAPDARAFLEAWGNHGPLRRIFLGEAEIDEQSVGEQVPQQGDDESEKPARDDVIAFGRSGGGDLFAIARNAKGVFSPVVRIAHDEQWLVYKEASSLERFIDACETAARKEGTQTSIGALKEKARPVKKAPVGRLAVVRADAPARPVRSDEVSVPGSGVGGQFRGEAEKPPGLLVQKDFRFALRDSGGVLRELNLPWFGESDRGSRFNDRVIVSGDGRRALIYCCTSAHLVDTVTGDVTRLVRGALFGDAAFLDGDHFALLKCGTEGDVGLHVNRDTAELWPGELGFRHYYSRSQLLVGSLSELGRPLRVYPLVGADWLRTIVGGRMLALGTREDMHRSRRNRTSFFRWSNQELYKLLEVKRSLVKEFYDDGLYEVDQRWFSQKGFEIVNVEEELARPLRPASRVPELCGPPQATLARSDAVPVTGAAKPEESTPSVGQYKKLERFELNGVTLWLEVEPDDDGLRVVKLTIPRQAGQTWSASSDIDVGCAVTLLAVAKTWAILTPMTAQIAATRTHLAGDVNSFAILAHGDKFQVVTIPFPVTEAWSTEERRFVRDQTGQTWEMLAPKEET